MNYIDFIIAGVVFIGFILGFKDGLVRKIIGLIGLAVAIFLAIKFNEDLGLFIAPVFNNEIYLANIIAGVLIFLTVVFLVSIIKRVIHPLDKVNKFFNQLLGGISGMIQVLFFLSAFLLLLNIFDFPAQSDRENSLSYKQVYKILPVTIDFILSKEKSSEDLIKDFIDEEGNYDIFEEK